MSAEKVSFDWATLKRYRDRYIQRLNGIYESGLDKLEVDSLPIFTACLSACLSVCLL